MGSTIIGFSTPHHARGQVSGACEALALPLTLSGMCNNVPICFASTAVPLTASF